MFSIGSNAVDLDATKSSTGSVDLNSPSAPFTFNFNITRTDANAFDLSSVFSGGDGSLSQTYSITGIMRAGQTERGEIRIGGPPASCTVTRPA